MYNGMLAMFPFGFIFILLPIKLIGIYFIEKQIYTNNAFLAKLSMKEIFLLAAMHQVMSILTLVNVNC